MASPSFDRWIDQHLARLQFGLFLEKAAEWFTGFLFLYGGVVLLVKRTLPQFWPHVLWVGLLAIPVALIAWYFSLKKSFSREESVALLDRKMNAGGLLMTLSELPDERWQAELPRIDAIWKHSLPRIRPFRFTRFLIMPLLFVIGAASIPLTEAVSESIKYHDVSTSATEQLKEMLTTLEEQNILEDKEEEELREEIQKLADEAKKNQALTHEKWETVDSLQQRLQMRLEIRRMQVAKAKAAAGKLAKAARSEIVLSLEEMEQLQNDIQDALQKLRKHQALSKEEKQAVQNFIKNGGLSKNPEERKKQLETLKKLAEDHPETTEMLRKLSDQSDPAKAGAHSLSKRQTEALKRLIKRNRQQQLSSEPSERQEQLDELQDFLDNELDKLAECRKKCQGGICQGEGECNLPGQGGITRGRGDAALNYGDESDTENIKFKETVLPPGYLDKPRDEVVGLSATLPDVNPAKSAPRSNGRNAEPATGRETWNRELRPRHRQVVRKYFKN